MTCTMALLRCRFPAHRSWFITKEDMYPFTSGASGTAGACNKARTASVELDDKVQLTGGGFKQLRQWSAAALREVGHRGWQGQARCMSLHVTAHCARFWAASDSPAACP